MCTAQTAKRRRTQARKNYRHLAPLRRPVYNKRSVEKAARILQRQISKLKMIATRKGQKK